MKHDQVTKLTLRHIGKNYTFSLWNIGTKFLDFGSLILTFPWPRQPYLSHYDMLNTTDNNVSFFLFLNYSWSVGRISFSFHGIQRLPQEVYCGRKYFTFCRFSAVFLCLIGLSTDVKRRWNLKQKCNTLLAPFFCYTTFSSASQEISEQYFALYSRIRLRCLCKY